METRSHTGKIDIFLRNLDPYNIGLVEKGFLFSGKMLICGWNLPYLEVNRIYANGHSPEACIIPTF